MLNKSLINKYFKEFLYLLDSNDVLSIITGKNFYYLNLFL